MTRILITLMAVMAAISCRADRQETKGVIFPEIIHDFGAFSEDAPRKTTFLMINATAEPVTIVSATATCGCTTPTYPREAIAPGDTARIEVSYDPAGRPGRFDKNVYVRTSLGDKTKLTIKGVVIGSPESVKARYPAAIGDLKLRNGVAMMGKVYKGHAKMQYIDVYNASTDSLSPVIVKSPDYIDVKVSPEDIGPGEQASLSFYYRADRCPLYGVVNDSVMISAVPGGRVVALPVVAIVEEDFTTLTPEQRRDAPHAVVSPERVVLDGIAADSGMPVTATVTVTNHGHDPLMIRRAYTQDPGVIVEAKDTKIKSGKSGTIEVTVLPEQISSNPLNAKILLITNDPAHPTIDIRVVGTGGE